MPRIAEKISDDEAEGKISHLERRAVMDGGLREEPTLQEYESVDVNDSNVIRPKLKQWDPAKKRTAAERKAYAGAEHDDRRVLVFPTVKPKEEKRYRRRKPWSPMDENDVPDPDFKRKSDADKFKIVRRRVPDPCSEGEFIEVDANVIRDELARMLAWRQINVLQFDTGRELEALFDATERGDLHAADPTRDIVQNDTRDYVNCAHLDKVKRLEHLKRHLLTVIGKGGVTVLWWVVKDGIPIKEIAAHLGARGHKPVLRELKDALDDLALYFHEVTKPDKWQRFAA
jgi:hypothetical protein